LLIYHEKRRGEDEKKKTEEKTKRSSRRVDLLRLKRNQSHLFHEQGERLILLSFYGAVRIAVAVIEIEAAGPQGTLRRVVVPQLARHSR
jgi:hypothetical protein